MSEDRKGDSEGSAKAIIHLVQQVGIKLFRTPAREPYASIVNGDHWETCRTKGAAFIEWISTLCYRRKGFVPNQKTLGEVANTFTGHARYAAPEELVYVRFAGSDDVVYVDLGNKSWEAVKITSAGWEVVSDVPVRFVRGSSMLALPSPVRGGSVNELRPLVNLEDEDHWKLAVGFLIGAMRPTGPFPLLFLEGTHGSAKSTLARMLRALVDPNSAPLRAQPANGRDLAISAENGWCLGFDNVSSVSPWLSDALCRLSTGGGLSTRALYTDAEEKIFDGTRPVLLTGIDMCIGREDLLDRGIFLSLPPIRESARLTETELRQRFEDARPRILGSLYDAISCALRRMPGIKLSDLPRMADFATWVCAGEVALGWPEGAFLDAYKRNRAESNALALESSPLLGPILRIVDQGPWEGTATELMDVLKNELLNEAPGNYDSFPKTPRELSQSLRRLAPNLHQAGIDTEFGRTAGDNSKRTIRITKLGIGARVEFEGPVNE